MELPLQGTRFLNEGKFKKRKIGSSSIQLINYFHL